MSDQLEKIMSLAPSEKFQTKIPKLSKDNTLVFSLFMSSEEAAS